MKVKILGTGCPKCKQLYVEAEKAIASSGMNVELEIIGEIIGYGVMSVPALVIDDKVKASGPI